ncbi:MAG: rRNA maturation RNase YbeY [Planctomycetales bacterium]|nr:rRNA maturation RNase YbeY [Planctomycetales bacterium]
MSNHSTTHSLDAPATRCEPPDDDAEPPATARLTVDLADEQQRVDVDGERIRQAILQVVHEAGVDDGYVSVALVDDGTIAELHERFLDVDGATDVLSFGLERTDTRLEGEIVVSTDTAAREAASYAEVAPGWSPDDEVLLYVVHGILHLVGYDDLDETAARQMRDAEKRHLAMFGLVPPGR